MEKILLFTGAGMSVPMGLPAAIGFTKTIKKCDSNLMNLLRTHLNTDTNDIEKILYVLEDFINGSVFYKHVLNSFASDTYFRHVNDTVAHYMERAIAFQQIVKHDIFKILQDFNSEKAVEIYTNLFSSFRELHGKNSSLSIFTTNYDLIFEDIIEENTEIFEKLGYKDFYFGFVNKWGKIRFDKTEDFEWANNIIEYNKLHGSLDWSKDNRGVVVKTGAITLPAIPDDMPLLYPGYKGTPTDEPFISIHNKLYLRLIQCNHIYVVGFAFRDPYINSIFEFALRANSKLIIHCYNPLSIENLPDDSAIPIFQKNNPEQFKYIQRGIVHSIDPLGILDF